jgi:hypothetical protein
VATAFQPIVAAASAAALVAVARQRVGPKAIGSTSRAPLLPYPSHLQIASVELDQLPLTRLMPTALHGAQHLSFLVPAYRRAAAAWSVSCITV